MQVWSRKNPKKLKYPRIHLNQLREPYLSPQRALGGSESAELNITHEKGHFQAFLASIPRLAPKMKKQGGGGMARVWSNFQYGTYQPLVARKEYTWI